MARTRSAGDPPAGAPRCAIVAVLRDHLGRRDREQDRNATIFRSGRRGDRSVLCWRGGDAAGETMLNRVSRPCGRSVLPFTAAWIVVALAASGALTQSHIPGYIEAKPDAVAKTFGA